MAAIASSWPLAANPTGFNERVQQLCQAGVLFGAAVLQARREREAEVRRSPPLPAHVQRCRDQEGAILKLLLNGWMTTREVAAATGLSLETARTRLYALCHAGLADVLVPEKPGAVYEWCAL